MYNTTYKVKKLLPGLQKKRAERIFYTGPDLARQAMQNKLVILLIREYGFTIQLQIQ